MENSPRTRLHTYLTPWIRGLATVCLSANALAEDLSKSPQIGTLIDFTNKRLNGDISEQTYRETVGPIIGTNTITPDLWPVLHKQSIPLLPGKRGEDLIRSVSVINQARAARHDKANALHEAAKEAREAAKAAAERSAAASENARQSPGDATKEKLAKEAATKAAAAAEVAAAAQSAVSRLEAENEAANSGWIINLWSGARLRNPYTITDSVLKPNNTKTDPFIEIQLLHRNVFIQGEYEDPIFYGRSARKWGKSNNMDFFLPGQVFPDLDLKIGYMFGGSSATNNVNISTIAGGSDIYSEGTVGIPFWRWSPATGWNQQLTVEGGGGFASDKQFMALHPNYFVGIGYQVHQKDWTWFTRFGYGGSDVPRRKDGTATILTQPDGMPYFDLESSPAWGAQILYRLNDVVSLQFGMNAYFHNRPDWNVSLGVLIDPQEAFKSFGKR